MSKEAFLHKTLGGNMAASLGVRDAAPTKAAAVPMVADKERGKTRMREAGYMLIEHITPDPEQVRTEFNQSAIDRLSKSLETHGMLMPIEVKWNADLGKHVITHGERRYRAAKQAGMESVPCIFNDGELTESEKVQRQLTENCLREDLSPTEQSRAFKSLKDMNAWTDIQLADALCLSRALVSQRLALLNLPKPIQEKVEDGTLSGAAGYQISRVEDADAQLAIVGRVEEENLNRDEVAALVKEATATKSGKKNKTAEKKGGRPEAVLKNFKTAKAAVTIKMNKKRVTDQDLLDATEEVRSVLIERIDDKTKKAAA